MNKNESVIAIGVNMFSKEYPFFAQSRRAAENYLRQYVRGKNRVFDKLYNIRVFGDLLFLFSAPLRLRARIGFKY